MTTNDPRHPCAPASPKTGICSTGNPVARREALRAEIEQNVRAMTRVPASGKEGTAGRRSK